MYAYKKFLNINDYFTNKDIDDLGSVEIGFSNPTYYLIDEQIDYIISFLIESKTSLFKNNLKQLIKEHDDLLTLFLLDNTERKKILDEIYIQVLLQILYDLNYMMSKNYFYPLNNIDMWIPESTSKLNNNYFTIKDQKYINVTKKGKEFLKRNYTDTFKEFQLENLKRSKLTAKKDSYLCYTKFSKNEVVKKDIDYINIFSLCYKKYLLSIYNNYKKMDSSIFMYNINENKYRNDYRYFERFFDKYTHNMKVASNFIKIYIDNNSPDYYIFIFQLFKQTQFHNIYTLSKITNYDYTDVQNLTLFDRNIRFTNTKYIDLNSISYDNDFLYFSQYISKIMKFDLSPSLLKYYVSNFFDLNILNENLSLYKKILNIFTATLLNKINKDNIEKIYYEIFNLLNIEVNSYHLKKDIDYALNISFNQYNNLNLLLLSLINFYKN